MGYFSKPAYAGQSQTLGGTKGKMHILQIVSLNFLRNA